MSPETLQTFGVMAIGLGFVLIGLGGFSTYHASQRLQHMAELREVRQKGEMDAQMLSLLLKNQELREKVEGTPTEATEPPQPSVHYFRPPSPPPPRTYHATPEREPAAREADDAPAPPAQPEPIEEAPAAAIAHPAEAGKPPEPALHGDGRTREGMERERAGRYLSARQRGVIADTLRAHGSHSVALESSYGDAASKGFAGELGRAFAEGGWVVKGIGEHHGLPLAAGVSVSAASFPPLPETRAVYEALLAAGIAVTQQLNPKQHTSETVVLVGAPL